MGLLAIGGHTGMMEYLSRYKKSRKILVHINNTNPILDEHSQERKYLLNRGIEVGLDGLEIELS
jgi:pyrroloquinoline quinone biosynthesis protein B